MVSKNSLSFLIKKPTTEQEWSEFHRIQKTEIIDQKANIVYNYNHPDLKKPTYYTFLFYEDNKIMGVVSTEQLTQNKWAIRPIAIDGKQKNRGLGTILIKMLEHWLKQQGATLIKLHASAKAINFYKRNGYEKMPFKEDKYQHSKCIDMGKYL